VENSQVCQRGYIESGVKDIEDRIEIRIEFGII